MRLPYRDFPVDSWTAGSLEVEAARLLREVFPRFAGSAGMSRKTLDRRRVKRSEVAYCAALLICTAREMRRQKRRKFSDMPEKARVKARRDADTLMASVAMGEKTIEQIIED